MATLTDEKYEANIAASLHEDALKDESTSRTQEADIPLEQRRAESRVMRKVDWRLIPILGLLYSVAGLDRVNVRSHSFPSLLKK